MKVESLLMFVVLVPFGMGLVTTLANCAAYMLHDAGSLFLLLVMALVLVAIVGKLYTVIFSMFGG
jgi:hypothetical protein